MINLATAESLIPIANVINLATTKSFVPVADVVDLGVGSGYGGGNGGKDKSYEGKRRLH
ncbi:hypothetical protein GGI21_003837, partial [Coemansia aciculifera]